MLISQRSILTEVFRSRRTCLWQLLLKLNIFSSGNCLSYRPVDLLYTVQLWKKIPFFFENEKKKKYALENLPTDIKVETWICRFVTTVLGFLNSFAFSSDQHEQILLGCFENEQNRKWKTGQISRKTGELKHVIFLWFSLFLKKTLES